MALGETGSQHTGSVPSGAVRRGQGRAPEALREGGDQVIRNDATRFAVEWTSTSDDARRP